MRPQHGGVEQMSNRPLSTGRASGEGALHERKRDLKQRIFDEVVKFATIVFYLWVMFGTFALHESVVSEKDHINFHFYGFAFVNALIMGKVMLVAEDLHFGGGSPSGVIFVGIILSVALTPFFAFREIGRLLGERELHSLVFADGAKAAFQSRIRKAGG